MPDTTILYRPVNLKELDFIRQSGWKGFPARLKEHRLFYADINDAYSVQISNEWNIPAYDVVYITRFKVNSEFISNYKAENAVSNIHNEIRIPPDDLDAFNKHIVGLIEVIGSINSQ